MSEAIGEILSGVIAFVGVCITGIISVTVIKKEIYSKRVIQERIKWLNIFKNHWGNFMSAWEVKRNSVNNHYEPNFDVKSYNELMIKGEKARYYMISMLNTNSIEGNECNFLLKQYLKRMNLVKEIPINELQQRDEKMEEFIECCNRMLEKVWQKAKKESGENEG